MKAIKFRMWNNVGLNPKKSKYFYDIDMVMDCLKQQMIFNQNPNNKLGYNHVGDGNSFEQFTGLKDKNKEDIPYLIVFEKRFNQSKPLTNAEKSLKELEVKYANF